MKYYLAPMDGITGRTYRNAHYSVFGNIDEYFAPFITPNNSKRFNTRELADLLPENNLVKPVPQILTDDALAFVETAKKLEQLGYTHININMGCPSNTVVSKNRGSGLLAFPDRVDRFLDTVFSHLSMDISVKTRTGRYEHTEFYKLLNIFNKYPLSELIIHPRTREDFYNGEPNIDIFEYALKESKNKVCYNGNVFTENDCKRLEKYNVNIMLGRGIIMNPMLMNDVKDKSLIQKFHTLLYESYKQQMNNERVTISAMKEVWHYMINIFSGNYRSSIMQASSYARYEEVIKNLFEECDISI